jgi:hypothetical protein
MIEIDGTYYAFYCSDGLPGVGWDAIRMISSTDGMTWTSPIVGIQIFILVFL